MTPALHELEQLVVDAWPAAHTAELDGWLLRASGGPTQRGNSVATLAADGLPLDERLTRAESWYRERGRSLLIQIGPCAAPAGLDRELEQRGFELQSGGVFALARARRVAELTRTELVTRVEPSPNVDWLAVAEGSSRHASAKDVLRGFLARLGARCRFVTAWVSPAQPAAICLGVTSPGWLGIYAMHTRPELRRHGAARAVLNALAESARAAGQQDLYLLVGPENAAARALYAQSGFEDVYGYHYRALRR